MKRITIEEKWIKIISVGAFYDNCTSDRAPSVVFLNEVYDENKDYNAELKKAVAEWNDNPRWTDYPEMYDYWKTIKIEEI